MADEQIRLVIPARAIYGRLARVASTAIARLMRFGYEQTGHIGLAVDEAVIFLLRSKGETHRISIVFEPTSTELVITARHMADGEGQPDEKCLDRFKTMAAETVDEFEISSGGSQVRLVKKRTFVD